MSLYCCFAPIYEDGPFLPPLDFSFFSFLLLAGVWFPAIFFIQTYFLRLPVSIGAKFLFFAESIFVLAFLWYFFLTIVVGIKLATITSHFVLVVFYVMSQSVAFMLWAFLLITPLSKYKFLNWPFAHRNKPKNE